MSEILIVEDEQDLADGLEINLSGEGYRVLKVTTGAAVMNLVIQKSPDLIILDIVLPDMSGFDVCRELRQKGLAVPIIMLTAKNEEIDRVVGLELGADDYVTKPFSMRELLRF
jgi:two-component system response regulator VicR